jgi:uncharacterized protein
MTSPHRFTLKGETLWLSPERCIFWEDKKALILSDLHLGKSGHFRKSGIAVPQGVFKNDLQRLFSQIQHFKPEQLIIVGDLFHSHANKEMDMFLKWRNDLGGLNMHLIMGNHDILAKKFYEEANIETSEIHYSENGFCFTHDINDVCDSEKTDRRQSATYTLSGHVHPGIRISGAGKQSHCFPCFYFGKEYAILPAFSLFTGMYKIQPGAADNIFAIVENSIIKM